MQSDIMILDMFGNCPGLRKLALMIDALWSDRIPRLPWYSHTHDQIINKFLFSN